MIDLSGLWQCQIEGKTVDVCLPGTLDENHLGNPDRIVAPWHPDAGMPSDGQINGPILTRLTRQFRYEGRVSFSRRVTAPASPGRRRFIEVERARMLELKVNDRTVSPFVPGTLSTSWLFEVTDVLSGDDIITFISDNTYEGLPGDAIRYSSAASDETQTNWNGLLGRLRLFEQQPCFVCRAAVYPETDCIRLRITLSADRPWQGKIRIEGEPLMHSVTVDAAVPAGLTEIHTDSIRINPDIPRWSIGKGKLLSLRIKPDDMEPYTAVFGMRTFTADNGRFLLNGMPVFLKGDTNCAVFPETGYPPMEKDAWTRILRQYMAYGINCLRFHSYIPPEAAFDVADELGLLMQPELSHWDPRSAFESPESRAYYALELTETLAMLANHPSFVMLTLGNELQYSDEQQPFVADLLNQARTMDRTRLYSSGSNNFYGAKGCDPASDFFMSCAYRDLPLRASNSEMTGHLNETYPGTFCFTETIRKIRRETAQPIIAFEAGQYETLPDFEQLERFRGVTRPDNLAAMRDKAQRSGLMDDWPARVNASGRLALSCYRKEIEAALLTEGLAGISLLSLQDFPGQGTALVGMMDMHLRAKPLRFDSAERFQTSFQDCMPIPCLTKHVYYEDEPFRAEIRIVNHSQETLRGCVTAEFEQVRKVLPEIAVPAGETCSEGVISFAFPALDGKPAAGTLRTEFAGFTADAQIWVFPRETVPCPRHVHMTKRLDDRALAVLEAGGAVYLAPDSDEESLPNSVREHFTTDFWSVGTFPSQPGGMGLMIDTCHPIFRHFPTDEGTDDQWWPMAGQRALVLPAHIRSIITQLDCPQRMRNMGMLLEGKCLNGRILVSSMGLHALPYPEASALQNAIFRYLGSDEFDPSQELPPDLIRSLIP